MKTNKKTRIGLSAATGLLAATGSIAPLTVATSCAQETTKNKAIDKEYGVSQETYDDLKEQFRIAYGQKLEKFYDVLSEDYKIRMEALEQDLASFDKAQDNSKLSYLALTNTLVDFAREHNQKYPTSNAAGTEPYGIRLVRHTRTKWSDLNNMYVGMADSFKTYMHNNRMPVSTINRILAESKTKFDALTKQLKATYGNDALSGLLKAKEQIITLFDDVNDDIALVSATLRLKDFMSEFAFEYRDYDENGKIYTENCLDQLEKDYPNDFVEGKILKDEIINKIFNITRKTTGQNVKFEAKTIVPGFTIQPKLTQISRNPRLNAYTISLDFGIVKNVYAQKYANDPESLALVTGHLYDFNSDDIVNGKINDNSTISDILKMSTIRTFDYDLRLTPTAEKQALIDSYFDSESEYGNISFKWDINNQAYECFFDNAKQNQDGTWTGRLETQSLANAGLMISYNNDKFASLNDVRSTSSKLENIKQQNLSDVFMQNCTLISNVNIDENNSKGKLVTHDFKVAYANSKYGTDAMYDLEDDYYPSECVDFNVSNNFFEKINAKYNEVASYLLNYDASLKKVNKTTNELSDDDKAKLELLDDEANSSMILKACYLAATGLAILTLIFFVWAPWKDGRSKKMNIICTLLCITTGILESANFTIFKLFYYDKAKAEVENLRKLHDKISTSEFVATMKQDLNDNFVLINNDGTYDKVKFASQKAKFNKKDMTEMLNLYRKYSTISQYSDDASKNTDAQNAMREFDQLLEESDIDSDSIVDTFDDWKPGTGKWWLVSFAISFVCMLVSSITLVVVRETLKSSAEKDSPTVETVDDAATVHSEEKVEELTLEEKLLEVMNQHLSYKAGAQLILEEITAGCFITFNLHVNITYKNFVNNFCKNENPPSLESTLEKIFGKNDGSGNTLWDTKTIKGYFENVLKKIQ